MNNNSMIRFFFPGFQILLLSLVSIAFTSINTVAQVSPEDYVTTWQTDVRGSGINQISIPAYGEYTVYYESIPAGISGTLPAAGTFTGFQTVTFPSAGTYRVAIKPTGSVPFHRMDFGNGGDSYQFLTIEQWGTTVWSSMEYAYSNCIALTTLSEIDVPVLSSVTSMEGAFYVCAFLIGSSNMNSWDVSTVTNMRAMFRENERFNQPLEGWNVSNVTTMQDMFWGAKAFNQPIDSWNVSNVTSMQRMFLEADSFNQPLGNWHTGNVTSMQSMFANADAFNQPLNNWNISNVTDFVNTFLDAAAFNQPLSKWTFNLNSNLNGMLHASGIDCGNYNTTLIGWAANPATPDGIYIGVVSLNYGPPASSAHDDLINNKGWSFNGDSFDASCTSLLSSANFVTIWKTDNVGPNHSGNEQIRIGGIGTNYNIIWEEVGNPANNGTETGSGTTTINLPVAGTYQVTISPGSGSLTGIDITNHTDANKLLEVSQWGDVRWEFMRFSTCENLKVTATDRPDLRSLTSMAEMFFGCTSLTDVPGINNWDLSAVTNMSGMFAATSGFNEPIGNWDVSNVTNMSGMFTRSAFNQPIGSWDVIKVTNMGFMFNSATNFNQSLNNWDVSSVVDMTQMFQSATAFNQPLNSWDVGQANLMSNMFYAAPAFNQSLSNWTLSSVADMYDLLSFSGMDCANMAHTLQGWATNPATPDNIEFGADGITYGLPAAEALETLRNAKGWTVTIGDGIICAPLEVSLILFDAKSDDGIVKLEWATASETDNDYFEIQRSADARNWNTIGRNEGAGTVNSVRHYSLTDKNPLEGTSYYRLKIVDLAGKADYSNVRAVNRRTGPTPSIYPNPATSSLTISGKIKGTVRIYNLSGHQVMQTQAETEKTSIPLSGLPLGSYIIKSDGGWNSKFVIN